MDVKRLLSIIMVAVFIIILPSQGLANNKDGMDDRVSDLFKDPKTQTEQPAEQTKTPSAGNKDVLEHAPPSISIFDFIKMMFALLFVLALLYGALKLINSKNRVGNGRSVENIGGTNLGNNKSLQLVKVGNSILVVGVGDSINLLKEITDEEEREQLLQSYRDRADSVPLHSDKLTGWIQKLKEAKKSRNQSGFSILLQDQLGQLSEDRKKKMDQLDNDKGFGR
ncbi:flagellar biosynthetic protein FliO [Sutcliffiella horikoshii]|uniref:flagellar biosynthetic protein FliO n=1 Tax=Sutcliffiella horikoshii TaxID=79883 RepID=UPI001EED85F4|nr:flagellar biosynthetic protein FliO [Sutcliffiella horikoshii]MCG1020660.1 flagella biosynthesis protein FliZ [Sutcliffiella horikoshii]